MARTDALVLDGDVLGTEMVALVIGKERKLFLVHKNLLFRRSNILKELCKAAETLESLSSGISGEIAVENARPDAFSRLVDYVYRSCVPTVPATDPHFGDEWRILMRNLYCLAEKYGMNDLANRVIDEIQTNSDQRHFRAFIWAKNVYEDTEEGSMLRWYCAVNAACYMAVKFPKNDHIDDIVTTGEKYPGFSADIIRAQAKHKELIRLREIDRQKKRPVKNRFSPCEFHVHNPGETCHSTGIMRPHERVDNENADSRADSLTHPQGTILNPINAEVERRVNKRKRHTEETTENSGIFMDDVVNSSAIQEDNTRSQKQYRYDEVDHRAELLAIPKWTGV